MEDSVEVIIGTYEDFLLGFKIVSKDEENKKTLIPTFSVRSHTSSIRTLAIGGKYIASGGHDDKIYIYDMKQRKELTILLHHLNAVNALKFTPDGSHLLSGGADGRMYATRVGNWTVGAEWKKAHGGLPVTNIACHSSSKLVMTLGSDLTLRTWNLVTGRCAFVINLKSKKKLQNIADCLQYSPESKHLALCGFRVIEIWDTLEAKIIRESTLNSRPVSLCWLTENDLIIGTERGKLAWISLISDDIIYFETTQSRIKAISYVNSVLATASSNGDIMIWNVNLETKKLKRIAQHNIGCRPTCMALLNLKQFDDNYKLEKLTDFLSDGEVIDEQLNLQKLKSNHFVGNVTIECNIDSKDDTSNQQEINKKLITSNDNVTIECNIDSIDDNSNQEETNKKLINKKISTETASNDNSSIKKRKNYSSQSDGGSDSFQVCFNSSDDEPIIKKKNYVTPLKIIRKKKRYS